MSPIVGTSVRWSHRNSAFCPVRSAAAAAAAADTPAAEMPFPAIATAGQLQMPYGFMSPYLWPLMLPYSPLAAAAGCAAAASGAGGHALDGGHHNQQQHHHLQQQQQQLQQQRLHQQISPDRAGMDTVTGQGVYLVRRSNDFRSLELSVRTCNIMQRHTENMNFSHTIYEQDLKTPEKAKSGELLRIFACIYLFYMDIRDVIELKVLIVKYLNNISFFNTDYKIIICYNYNNKVHNL